MGLIRTLGLTRRFLSPCGPSFLPRLHVRPFVLASVPVVPVLQLCLHKRRLNVTVPSYFLGSPLTPLALPTSRIPFTASGLGFCPLRSAQALSGKPSCAVRLNFSPHSSEQQFSQNLDRLDSRTWSCLGGDSVPPGERG